MDFELNLRSVPYIRISLSFIFGILSYDYLGFDVHFTIYILLIAAFLGLFFIFYKVNQYQNIQSSLLLAAFFVFGALTQHNADTKNRYKLLQDQYKYIENVEGKISSPPVHRNRIRIEVNIEKASVNGELIPMTGNLILYFKAEDTVASQYLQGQKIRASGYVDSIRGATNPNAFDFVAYLHNRRLDYQMTVKSGEHELLNYQIGWLDNLVFKVRNYAINCLENYLEGENLAVANAMILGQRNLLDEDLYSAFTDSGAVHVLAVSGLHVGIVTALFIILFSKIRSTHLVVKLLKAIILIFIAVMFAMVTGAAPAVVRATIMFSLLVISKLWRPHYNVFNILAICALVMLLSDPNMLYQASFQFSFLALASIAFFYPLFQNFAHTGNKFLDYFISLAKVSVAAQILVFPLTIFYFHKFPLYFILSGLLAIPAAIIILIAGMFLFVFNLTPFSFLCKLLALILNCSLTILNYGMKWIQELPFASLNGLWLSWVQIVILYLLIGGVMLMIVTRYKALKYLIGLMWISFLVYTLFSFRSIQKYRAITIYDVYKGVLIDVFCDRNLYTFKTPDITDRSVQFAASNNRQKFNIKSQHFLNGDSIYVARDIELKPGEIQIDNTKIVLVNYNTSKDELTQNPDYFIIVENLPYDLATELLSQESELIVPRLSDTKFENWLKKNSHKPIRFVRNEGAIVLDLTQN